MPTRTAKLITAAALAALALATGGCVAAIAPSGTGYKAQTVCSAVFISRRDSAGLETAEFAGLHPLLGLVRYRIDHERQEVRASLAGLGRQKAVYREGLGCTLVNLKAPPLPPAPPKLLAPRPDPPDDAIQRGVVAALPASVDAPRLAASVEAAFAEPDPAHPRRTRALLVLLDGRLIVERYAPGFHKDMPLPGWSMTKTMTGAMAGILVGQGLLDHSAPAPVASWRHAPPQDQRAAITVDDLLHMTTGGRWSENAGNPLSEVLIMMYHKCDMAAYAAALPINHPPGTRFGYNSGTTNILSRVLLVAMGGDRAAYLALPRTALFDPAGMNSAIIAPDASGTLAGATAGFATARDWARFGEIYRNDGVAPNGVRVLPPGWVAASAEPNAASAERGYGAHIWVNKVKDGDPRHRPRPSLPEDTMLMNGQFGQLTAVVPSRGVTIVRLGDAHDWDFSTDPDALVADILAAIQPSPQGRSAVKRVHCLWCSQGDRQRRFRA